MTWSKSSVPRAPQLPDPLFERARKLGLYGLLSRWEEFRSAEWLAGYLEVEEQARDQRSLDRRQRQAGIGTFKLLADFDWAWPKEIDRDLIEELFTFRFLEEKRNVLLFGPNGIGKTMLTQNLVHQALLRGYTARMVTASQLLNDLTAQEGAHGLQRVLRRYMRPALLAIDELGYLAYDNRHADLLFEIVSRRYESKSLVITSNRRFQDWNQTFPNATCVVALVDRLVHRSEIVRLDGESYRKREAEETATRRELERKAKPKSKSQARKSS